jgi:hypothetical protein
VFVLKDYFAPHIAKTAISNGFMKPDDFELITLARRIFSVDPEPLSTDAALFYPSAGSDLITPLIIALPYCSQFFFYDHDLSKPRLRSLSHKVFNYICQIEGITATQTSWIKNGRGRTLIFEYHGIEKMLNWVNDDNLTFLSQTHLKLAFYFHRGDSYGEGGSGQFWDSTLLSDLREMIKPGGVCYYITTGEPGGPAFEIKDADLKIEKDECVAKYYIGQLKNLN